MLYIYIYTYIQIHIHIYLYTYHNIFLEGGGGETIETHDDFSKFSIRYVIK